MTAPLAFVAADAVISASLQIGDLVYTGDVRSLIYAGAFGGAVRAGKVPPEALTVATHIITQRRQLVAINGRPC